MMEIIRKIHVWTYRILLSVSGIPVLLLSIFTAGFGLVLFLNTPGLTVLLLGLYLQALYKYTWDINGYDAKRVIIAITLFLVIFLYNVIGEFINPSLRGPMMWAIVDRPIDYPSMWFDNWRFWWTCKLAESSLFISLVIIYITMLGRWIYLRLNNSNK